MAFTLSLRKVRVSPPMPYHVPKYPSNESTSGYDYGRSRLDDTPGLKWSFGLPIVALGMGKNSWSQDSTRITLTQ